jgi:hypothetical protein
MLLAGYSQIFSDVQRRGPELKDLKKIDFWTGLQGIRMISASPERPAAGPQDHPSRGASKPGPEPSAGRDDFQDNIELVSSTLLFLVRAGIIFLELRLIWLLVQYAARYLLQMLMSESTAPGVRYGEPGKARSEPLFPTQTFVDKIRRSPLSFFLHPFIRLKLMLSGFQKTVAAENLFEKERRVVDADWNILYGSWGPYRILFWVLPALGLAQTILLLVAQFNLGSSAIALAPQKEAFDVVKPMLGLASQKEIVDSIKPSLNLLLPLIQTAGVAIFFQLASTFLRYLEELYLFNLDSFIYDRLLSRLPLQSGDTLVILESLQGRFKELHAAIKRLESKVLPQSEVENRK